MKISTLAVAAIFSLATVSANAAEYEFNDIYKRRDSLSPWDIYYTFTNASRDYSSSIVISANNTFTYTFKTGDTLFGTYIVDTARSQVGEGGGDPNNWDRFYANLTFTGGTGLFTVASGTGLINATPNVWNELSARSFVTAVPEADTSAMLLMGAGVLGFMARRRKQVAA
jgi:hypothetical protein